MINLLCLKKNNTLSNIKSDDMKIKIKEITIKQKLHFPWDFAFSSDWPKDVMGRSLETSVGSGFSRQIDDEVPMLPDIPILQGLFVKQDLTKVWILMCYCNRA